MKERDCSYRTVLVGLIAVTMLFLSSSLVCAEWVDLSPPDVSSEWSLSGVHFTSADEGWAVGSDRYNGRGVLLHFEDESWTSIVPPVVSSDWELFGAHFTSATEGWAVGADYSNKKGVLLHYRDGSWAFLSPPPYSSVSWYLTSVYFTSDREGWAVGVDDSASEANRGVLLHYLNGSWSVVYPPFVSSSWTLNGVHFTSSGEGWAVGDNKHLIQGGGVLLHYHNGTWEKVIHPNAGTDWYLTSVFFTSSTVGWSVGNDIQYPVQTGLLFRYNNGTWTAVRRSHSSLSWNLFSTHFVSSTEGWVVGIDVPGASTQTGLLMHYSGGSWSFVTPPEVSSDWGLAGVHFTSSDEGWAVGRDNWNGRGVLLRYSTVPEIKVTPISIDFGNISAGKTSEKKITIQNMGGVNLRLDTIGSEAAPFVRSGGTCTDGKTLVPNASCTLLIEFAPDADGFFTASFDIASDDLDTPTVTVNLEGRSGPGDLTGTWGPLTQTCTTTTRGTRFKVRGTLVVENTGYKDVPSSAVYFYLSEDGSVDPPVDTYVKKSSTGKVKFEDSKNITFSYRFPYDVSVSGKYIIAVLDAKNKILEIDEHDNTVVSGEIPLPIP